ncbi:MULTISPECIES: porin [unclassified Herbaspirillum]|uniref:porin n=1 Tax=unclassified Herbaspirillum TaxID=2624150 RepID=UPI001151966C|nr:MULTISPECIES: porin [unclassified Herbaspirillum]MBB5393790.1 putative porin [Herbaspirillum sp. SJZ102]TQK01350.1 putative porin [Herbaspirillum sp. SJZ130]TQK05746.1 putative porin [Herbaspirillum sp. SJZ106]
MRKVHTTMAALALLGAAGAAQAQSSVQIYGLIDTAVEHLTNVNAAGDSLTRMPNLSGGMFPSRIGFRGQEDLGDGLRAVFTLENGLQPDSGGMNQGNRLFGRQAWVGLAGSFGTVTMGRTYSMLFQSFFDVDVIGPSQFSIGSLDLYLPNARHDNSISYKGVFSGLTVGATYSFGRDTSSAGGPAATNCAGENAADAQACRNWSTMLRYDAAGKQWGVLGAYDTYHGGAGAAAAFSPTSSARTDTRWHIAGYGKIGDATIAGGFLHRNNEGNAVTPTSTLTYLGMTYLFTPQFSLDAQVARLDFKNSPNDTNMAVVRGTYYLSKRTAIYGLVGRVSNGGTAAVALSAGATVAPGGTQNGIMTGIQHTF